MSAHDFMVASAAAGYPAPAARERLLGAASESRLPTAVAALFDAAPEDLESEYLRLFDFGVAENPLHETGYGRDRSLAVGERLADVAGFYRAFGVDGAGGERLDHLAVELEFYAWLLRKQAHLSAAGDEEGTAIVLDARRKFLVEHVGPLALSVGQRPAIVGHPLFGPVFSWICERILSEAAALGLAIAPLDLLLPTREPDEVACATSAQAPGGGRLPIVSA